MGIRSRNSIQSVNLVGVSKTMPISTGLQLVGTTLFSAIFLGEWSTGLQVTLGLIAMVLLVTGIALTSLKGKMSVLQKILILVKQW